MWAMEAKTGYVSYVRTHVCMYVCMYVRSRVQKFPAWHTKPRQMENAVRDI